MITVFSNIFLKKRLRRYDAFIRLISALITAHFVLVAESPYSFISIFSAPGYFPALCFLFLWLWFLFWFVGSEGYWLHAPLSGQKTALKISALLTAGVIMLSTMSYFWLRFSPFPVSLSPGYIPAEGIAFPMVIAFILVMHLYDAYRQFHSSLHRKLQHMSRRLRIREMREGSFRLADMDLESLGVCPTDIACAYVEQGVVKVHYLNQRIQILPYPLESLLRDLPPDDYFMINRFCLVHRILIFQIDRISSRRYRISMRNPFESINGKKQTEVSQDFSKAFAQWYHL